jgi:hypothetical protein
MTDSPFRTQQTALPQSLTRDKMTPHYGTHPRRLHLSEATVKVYVSEILARTACESRTVGGHGKLPIDGHGT